MNEAAVTAQSMALVGSLPGVAFGRNNTGALQDKDGRWIRFGLGHTAKGLDGSADYIGCVRGFFVGLEFKRTKGGRLSAGQRKWSAAWRVAGATVQTINEPAQAAAVVAELVARADFLETAELFCRQEAGIFELMDAHDAWKVKQNER